MSCINIVDKILPCHLYPSSTTAKTSLYSKPGRQSAQLTITHRIPFQSDKSTDRCWLRCLITMCFPHHFYLSNTNTKAYKNKLTVNQLKFNWLKQDPADSIRMLSRLLRSGSSGVNSAVDTFSHLKSNRNVTFGLWKRLVWLLILINRRRA